MFRILPALAVAAVASPAAAQTFDFEFAVDNGDGTVSNTQFQGTDDISGLAITQDVNGTNALQGTVSDADGFANITSNFSIPETFKQGGTLTGDAIFTDLGDPSQALEAGGPQVFLARQGSDAGYDLTDGSGNFQFTGGQTLNQAFSFNFTLPTVTGNDGFYGITLGASRIAQGGQVSFDNIVFTPVPEPASLALLGLGGLALLGRRRG